MKGVVKALAAQERIGSFMLSPIKHGPAPAGYRWVYCRSYRHYRSGKLMIASDYGYEAWAFLVRA